MTRPLLNDKQNADDVLGQGMPDRDSLGPRVRADRNVRYKVVPIIAGVAGSMMCLAGLIIAAYSILFAGYFYQAAGPFGLLLLVPGFGILAIGVLLVRFFARRM